MTLFEKILIARGIDESSKQDFLLPNYSKLHDPYLLSDMDKAVKRLVSANKNQDRITIYGDYDIDGLTATTLLVDAFSRFGYKNVDVFMPNRFIEGYGMTIDAVEKIASGGTNLIVTVDCGSLSHKEIIRANELGVDVIITDHHNVAKTHPPAVAVVNPKRLDNKYPFIDLAGVGVAFKLVQAMQPHLTGLPIGQEKWLLDLVALGTVCDVVNLTDENRINVFWGLRVLSQTRRPGLIALMNVARINPRAVNARSLGFAMGPRMNAAGRLETAMHALEMLMSTDKTVALERANYLDELNVSRRLEQDKIYKSAIAQAETYKNDSVLVLSDSDWNHGIVGIVAAKILEKYKKPTFVMQEMGETAKGSARSYGNFSAVDAIRASEGIIIKGGGHKLAAGVTMPTKNIAMFRKSVNDFYKSQNLTNQKELLLPTADVEAELDELDEELVNLISQLEPFGNGNPQPVFKTSNLLVKNVRKMGSDAQHIKIELADSSGKTMQFLAFSAPDYFFVDTGQYLDVWYHIDTNDWQGYRSIEGKLLHIELVA